MKPCVCKRCGHEWVPRVKKPVQCVACKSYRYLIEKKVPKKETK
jgi:predicted Zn-ribbon and HTH transcriptional regulator